MKQLHTISGLPRSGSTLLCNLLNMNPRIHATSTSYIADMLRNMRATYSHNFTARTHNRLMEYNFFRNGLNGFLEGYYSNRDIVLDKDRSWIKDINFLDTILGHSDSRFIWSYRNPVDIINSIERRHQQTILLESLDEGQGIQSDTLDLRVDNLLNDNSILCSPVRWLDDALKQGYANRIFILKYEDLVNNTVHTLNEVNNFIGIPDYNYNIPDLKQNTFEFDGMYNYKFMHNIKEGEVKEFNKPNLLQDYHIEQINKRFEWLNAITNKKTI